MRDRKRCPYCDHGIQHIDGQPAYACTDCDGTGYKQILCDVCDEQTVDEPGLECEECKEAIKNEKENSQ